MLANPFDDITEEDLYHLYITNYRTGERVSIADADTDTFFMWVYMCANKAYTLGETLEQKLYRCKLMIYANYFWRFVESDR